MYTRGGDKGETGLYGAKRVAKDSLRVEAYGAVDELNSQIGAAIAVCGGLDQLVAPLKRIQAMLFVAGADLAAELEGGEVPAASRRTPRIERKDTEELERMIDSLQEKLPRLTNFILPGGAKPSAFIHLARSVCRRTERGVVTLGRSEKINPELLPYLNRLSTYLFNLARYSNVLEGVRDETWSP